jgi:hypothetical protein
LLPVVEFFAQFEILEGNAAGNRAMIFPSAIQKLLAWD